LTDCTREEIVAVQGRLAHELSRAIPAGVGSTGRLRFSENEMDAMLKGRGLGQHTRPWAWQPPDLLPTRLADKGLLQRPVDLGIGIRERVLEVVLGHRFGAVDPRHGQAAMVQQLGAPLRDLAGAGAGADHHAVERELSRSPRLPSRERDCDAPYRAVDRIVGYGELRSRLELRTRLDLAQQVPERALWRV